jgi:flagellin-like protein
MKNLRKIRKNTKALSPVVASIILIAVTVAVSIAVAAWMGALTVGFMDTKTVTITNAAFDGTDVITLTVKNTGTSEVTISTAKVNGDIATITTNPSPIADGSTVSVVLQSAWLAGNNYKMDLFDSNGQLVGSYQATAA